MTERNRKISRSRFFNRFLWRVAGFPCDDLERFALSDIAKTISESIAISSASHTSWKRRFSQFNEQKRARASRLDFWERFARLRVDLARLAREERFRLAVSSSSPLAAERMSNLAPGEARRSKQKRIELLAMRYLQRFCTKCETSSFIGPIATGDFRDQRMPAAVHLDLRSYNPKAYVSNRLLQAIIGFLRTDLTLLQTQSIRRYSGIQIASDGHIITSSGKCFRIGTVAQAVLEMSEHWIPVAIVCRNAGVDSSETLAAIHALISIGVVTDGLDSCYYEDNPISHLRQRSAALNGGNSHLDAFLQLIEKTIVDWRNLNSASRSTRVFDIIQRAKSLGLQVSASGGFYSDRLPIIEDGELRDAELSLDWDWSEPYLEDLDRVLQEGILDDISWLSSQRDRLSDILHDMSQSEPNLGMLIKKHGLGAFRRCPDVPSNAPSNEQDVKAITGPVVLSPDIMFAPRLGSNTLTQEVDWILGDCHAATGCAGYFVRPMADRQNWISDLSTFVRDRLEPSEPVFLSNRFANKTFFLAPLLECRYIENNLEAPELCEIISLDDLRIDHSQELKLLSNNSDRSIVIMPSNFQSDSMLYRVFGTPRYRMHNDEKTSARKSSGRIVIQRARWTLRSSEIPGGKADAWESFVWAQFLRDEKQLPRWIFVHVRNERKPTCVDLENPFLCEELIRLVRSNKEVSLVEMYPSPDEAWVSYEGNRYLSEIRLLYVARG